MIIKKKIAIVGGLGHVGLPLSFSLALKKFDVTSIDIDKLLTPNNYRMNIFIG